MADRDELKAGERRVATILFSDMKGFTSLSEHADPEEMDGLMGRIFGLFEEIIRSYGGQVEKYIGDALVAVFGVSELHEDDPSRAVRSALEFQTRLQNERSSIQGRFVGRGGIPNISFRTGIHIGLVTTGRRGEFDVVTGHAMNVAQRIEAAAAPGSVFVSEAVREKCEGEFEFEGPRRIEAKGKTEPVTVYQVKGEVSGAVRDASPLVGRRELLDEMLKAYIRNRYDEVSGFYLSGEAGSGKTRVITAFLEKLRQFPDFTTPILSARAQKFRPGSFSVILDVLLGYLGLDSPVDRESAAQAAAGLPGIGEAVAGRFTEIACCADPGSPDSSSIATLYDVFEAVLERHAGDLYPIVVCVDNAASMDRLSREFFQYFFKHGRIKPFFLLAGREMGPELRKVFQGLKAIRLGPLSAEESEALVRFHWPEAEAEGLQRILSLSSGNPLFLREYAAYARKHRDLSLLPATVQNIFLASLERYPPEWRDLAKRLSAFLHSFSPSDARFLQGASEAEAPWVDEALAQFEADGLLLRENESFCFRLDVFKKALYSSLLNHNKRVLHGLIADILLRQERPHRIRLIHHLVRAERYAEAAKALFDDPDRTYNYEVLPYIDILIRRLKEDGKAIIRLLITKAAQLFNGGKIEESEAVLKRIMRTAVIRRDATLMGYAYHQICAYNHMTYSFQKAIFAGQKALYYYRRSDIGARSVQSLLHTVAQSYVMRNELDEARRIIGQCEAIPGGDPAEAWIARAEYQLLTGDYEKALSSVDRILRDLSDQLHSSFFFALDLKVKTLWQLCDFQGMRECARRLVAIGSLSESSVSQANALLGLASVFFGDKEEARDRFVQAEFYAGQIRNDFERVDSLRTLALCRFLAGEQRKAEATALEALTMGLRHSCYWPTFSLLILLAEVSHDRGNEERSRFFLVEASYFFTTGYLLPSKDVILYYYLAAKLLDPASSERNMAVAFRLLEEEKSRLGIAGLISGFLSIRSYGKIQEALDLLGAGKEKL